MPRSLRSGLAPRPRSFGSPPASNVPPAALPLPSRRRGGGCGRGDPLGAFRDPPRSGREQVSGRRRLGPGPPPRSRGAEAATAPAGLSGGAPGLGAGLRKPLEGPPAPLREPRGKGGELQLLRGCVCLWGDPRTLSV